MQFANGRTRHVDVCNHFFRDLKDAGMLIVRHIFTKNATRPIFQRHLPTFVGTDKYMSGKPETRRHVRRLCGRDPGWDHEKGF